MGSRYLTDLAAVCRAAGLFVQEEPGWQTRARGSGGYEPGRPTAVMVHHTASNPSSDGQADVNYCCHGSADAPLANLYLNRAGKVWVMAAGATNTNGSGHDSWGGGVPDDSMNTHAIGIEAANNGTGEPWPQAQQEAYSKLVQALQDAYLIPVNNVREHAEWAPGRKIDPAGPSRWAQSGTWNGGSFRNDIAAGWPGTHPPIPLPLEDEPVEYLEVYRDSKQYSLFARSGVVCVNITNAERDADKATRDPAPDTVKAYDAGCLKALVLLGDAPVWYDGSAWPPVSAFGGHVA
jgi:N-acetylmuramoyl-L-alanine amidase